MAAAVAEKDLGMAWCLTKNGYASAYGESLCSSFLCAMSQLHDATNANSSTLSSIVASFCNLVMTFDLLTGAQGTIFAQFKSPEGEGLGPQLEVPLGLTTKQLNGVLNELLSNDRTEPYSFYVNDEVCEKHFDKAHRVDVLSLVRTMESKIFTQIADALRWHFFVNAHAYKHTHTTHTHTRA
jgi:hypothetical protein